SMCAASAQKFSGKTAIVTGAASGIGRAIAKLFAAEGAAVVLADTNEPEGRAVEGDIVHSGGRAIFQRTDVTSDQECRRLVQRANSEYGSLHLLVNSAGIIVRASVTEITEEEWDRVMAVNVKSIFLAARHAVPAMVSSGGGCVVNIASGWGLAGGPRAAAY